MPDAGWSQWYIWLATVFFGINKFQKSMGKMVTMPMKIIHRKVYSSAVFELVIPIFRPILDSSLRSKHNPHDDHSVISVSHNLNLRLATFFSASINSKILWEKWLLWPYNGFSFNNKYTKQELFQKLNTIWIFVIRSFFTHLTHCVQLLEELIPNSLLTYFRFSHFIFESCMRTVPK